MAGYVHTNADGRLPPVVFVQTWGVEGDYLTTLGRVRGKHRTMWEPPNVGVLANALMQPSLHS